MKDKIHPKYFRSKVICSGCGNTFETGSTLQEIRIMVCSQCHPFYTGKQVMVDTEGRVDRFKKKYAKFQSAQPAAATK
ncbi:MAG: 50S ribosomal protein L31 [Bdellovibrionota bacterium]|nr:MAG: 50S ribosomal protein L31 [Bdellovibrionota bacterium]